MKGYDPDTLRECMFGETTGPILAELEEGPKSVQYLAEKCDLKPDQISESLRYMVEHGFLTLKDDTYTADAEKLAAATEDDGNYSGIINSITEMDSYLN